MNEYIQAKRLIRKCFNINFSIPKGYGTRSSDYQKWYNMKEHLIDAIVLKIKENKLPIKYGVGRDECGWSIIYFEFEGQQFSFHQGKNIKKFNGQWTGVRRSWYECKNRHIIGERDIRQ